MNATIERGLGTILRRVHAGQHYLAWNHPVLATLPDVINLNSPAFADGQLIPQRYAAPGIGENLSPPLNWSNIPPDTAELILIMEDPDAPLPRPVVHALVLGIPPNTTGLPESAFTPPTPPIHLGCGSFNRHVYSGPRPVLEHGPHHYHFQLIASGRPLAFTHPPTRNELLAALADSALAKGRLIGTYERS